ncbi:MAG: diiron oxygenase [Acidimicrobiales bacterium]
MSIDTQTPTAAAEAARIDSRIERLSTASLRRVIEPDVEVAGSVGPGMVVPRDLLSVAGLDLELSEEQWVRLSREEMASIVDSGVRFESVLLAGFGLMIASRRDLTDPRVTYVLHELGEETRHSRLFVRLIEQLSPTARNPFARGLLGRLDRFVTPRVIRRRALFCVLVLTGEEVPDLLQKRSSEHPDTDPFVREVNKYHRMEEARHLSFGRMILPELWEEASPLERFAVRHLVPAMMAGVFDGMVHPGVYATVGLPAWPTWNAVRRSPARRQLRAEALRPVCAALLDAGAFGRRGRLPRAWRTVCWLDRGGAPLPAAA